MQRCELCDQANRLHDRLLVAERGAIFSPQGQRRLARIGERALARFWARWSVHCQAAASSDTPLRPDVAHHEIYGYQKRYAVSVTTRTVIVE